MAKAFLNGNKGFAFLMKSLKMEGSSMVSHVLSQCNFAWIDHNTFFLYYVSWNC